MTADLSALIARLEAAEAGSRELDAAVYDALLPRFTRDGEAVPGLPGRWPFAPGSAHDAEVTPVTTSLNAALALAERVLPGWRIGLNSDPDRGPLWAAQVKRRGETWRPIGELAPTPALALCIAILKSKMETEK